MTRFVTLEGVRRFMSVLFVLSLALATASCGGDGGGGRAAATPTGDGAVEERVIVERLPDGSVKKTVIRTTRRTVDAPPPPPRPADPYPADPLVRYNVERVNGYRAQKGLPPLLYDARISAFAYVGSQRLSHDHTPHAHFAAHGQGAPGFGPRAAENQGDPAGVPALDADAWRNGTKQVDIMIRLMMDEGPGGGHYDNIMNPTFRRIGIGLYYARGKLYLTNDFSD